ncbi:hypothetical protein Tco_0140058 [Tanacetum coccineum]
MRPILRVLQIGIRAKVMDAHTLPVSTKRNLGDLIEIRVDIVHPAPVDVFPAVNVVRTLAQHEEAIQGIHKHLQGVPINEEMSALIFRMGMAEEENASLHGGPATRPRELQEAPGVCDQSARTSLIDTLF